MELDGKSFYSQLKGKSRKVRQWVYCWYAPQKVCNKNATVFARTHQYKLYRSGEFYDVQRDFYETQPILEEQMTNKQKKYMIFCSMLLINMRNVLFKNSRVD